MTMTETRPPAPAVPHDSEEGSRPLQPEEAPGLAGWLVTGDHKRIGRLYIGTALVFLLAGGVLGAVVGAERVDSGVQVFGDQADFQLVYTLHGSVSVFLFLVPLFLGLATYVVPLQVGAANVAFPRLSALSYWAYLVFGGILVAAYASDGGPFGGNANAVDLWLVSVGGLTAATVLALVSVLATIIVLRAPGMTLLRTPAFSWSLLVGGGLTLLAAPVLVANVAVGYIAHHHGGFESPGWEPVAWFFRLPQMYLLVVPAAGVAAEIVPVLTRARQLRHGAVLGVLAAIGVLGFGAFAYEADVFAEPYFAGTTIAVILPVLGLVALLADTSRRGGRLAFDSPMLFAFGAVNLLFLGALAGGAAVIDPLELEGTTWLAGTLHLVLFGGGVLGAFAGVAYWAPKIWGSPLDEWPARTAFLLTFLGALLLALPDLVSGLGSDQPLLAARFADDTLTVSMNLLAEAGAALAVLGTLVFVAAVVRAARAPDDAPADPWEGHTLEWATASPPPPGNFGGPLPLVQSPAPLLDARAPAAAAGPPEITTTAASGASR